MNFHLNQLFVWHLDQLNVCSGLNLNILYAHHSSLLVDNLLLKTVWKRFQMDLVLIVILFFLLLNLILLFSFILIIRIIIFLFLLFVFVLKFLHILFLSKIVYECHISKSILVDILIILSGNIKRFDKKLVCFLLHFGLFANIYRYSATRFPLFGREECPLKHLTI